MDGTVSPDEIKIPGLESDEEKAKIEVTNYPIFPFLPSILLLSYRFSFVFGSFIICQHLL